MNLKQLRKAQKLTQADLAYQMGISVDGVKRWERGGRGIASRHFIRLARLFEVSVEDILTASAETKQLNAREIT